MALFAALVPFTSAAAVAELPAYLSEMGEGLMGEITAFMNEFITEESGWAQFFLTKGSMVVNEVQRTVDHAYQMVRIFYLITTIVLICKCFFQFGDLIKKIFYFFFDFIGWFFPKFIPWFMQFVSCTISKIMHLPQCFLWYGLDTAGWIFYLPFRLLFWILDEMLFSGIPTITKGEHDLWKYMYEFDNYIHDGLKTGIHLFHFPDSVTNTCYQCKIANYPPGPTFPIKAIEKFIECILTPF